MKIYAQPAIAALLAAFLIAGCDPATKEETQQSTENQSVQHSDPFAAVDDEVHQDQRIPATLDEALDLMMQGLTDEDRKLVDEAGEDYATMAHFGGGMGMRNSWGLWGDSPLRRFFARLGIYHADDMSAIINTAFSRRVRGKDIELKELVRYYRDYWAKTDTIAPLDLNCPTCGKEMETGYRGSGVSRAHPEREYFFGTCRDDEREFLFYHKDGWKPSEIVESEQGVALESATRSESDSEGGEKPQPESEPRPR